MLSLRMIELSLTNSLKNIFLDLPYELIPNRRGGLNLWFNGHVYRKKVEYVNTVNWVCLQNSCPARVTTKISDQSLKESKKEHNHPPKYDILAPKYEK